MAIPFAWCQLLDQRTRHAGRFTSWVTLSDGGLPAVCWLCLLVSLEPTNCHCAEASMLSKRVSHYPTIFIVQLLTGLVWGPGARRRLYNSTGFLFLCWAAHYFPFWLMGRQRFLHHYLPAHLASTMVTGALIEFIFNLQPLTPPPPPPR